MVRTSVPPVLTSVALSRSMDTTRASPSFSPTNSVLPLITTQGLLGFKTMPCSLSGGDLGTGGGAIDAEGVSLLSCSCLSGGPASGVGEVSGRRFATSVTASGRGDGSAGGLGSAAAATNTGGGAAGCGAIVACAAGGVSARTSCGLCAVRRWAHCQTKRSARSAATASAAGTIRLRPCRGCCEGSTGRNCIWGEDGGGACRWASLARFKSEEYTSDI